MKDHIDQAAELAILVSSLMTLVAELRTRRDHDQMFSPDKVTFSEVVDKAAGVSVEETSLAHLKEVAKILDENEAAAVDDDLTRRMSDAAAIAMAIATEDNAR